MNEPKNDRNPDELQPETISDKTAKQWAENYEDMEKLEDFDPDAVKWEPMKDGDSQQ